MHSQLSSPRRQGLALSDCEEIDEKRRSRSLDNLHDYTVNQDVFPSPNRKPKLQHTVSSLQHRVVDKPKLGHTLSLTGNRFKTDSPSLSYQKLDKLLRKRDKTHEELRLELGRKDENVRDFLKTAENQADTSLNDLKSNFERNNMKTNTSIQLLQKKLEKYQQQIKEIEDNPTVAGGNTGGSGGMAIIKVVQHSVQSGTSHIADAVAKPLESINNFMKKEKKSRPVECEDDNYLACYHSVQSTSDEECCSNSSPKVTSRLEHLEKLHQEQREEDVRLLQLNIERVSRDNEESKQLIEDYKERLALVLESIQLEAEKREQLEGRLQDLYSQWNDSTELHQNEMYGMKEEMERAMETIECVEYRFTGRTADIEEEVDNCKTRLSKLELQQQQQHQPRVHTFLDIDAKIQLSRICSFIIYLVVVVVVIAVLPLRFMLSSKVHVVVSVVAVVVCVVVWKWTDVVLGWDVLQGVNVVDPQHVDGNTTTDTVGGGGGGGGGDEMSKGL